MHEDNKPVNATTRVITVIDRYDEDVVFHLFDFIYDCVRCGMTHIHIGETLEKLKSRAPDGLRPSFGIMPKLFEITGKKQHEHILLFVLDCWIANISVISCSLLVTILNKKVQFLINGLKITEEQVIEGEIT